MKTDTNSLDTSVSQFDESLDSATVKPSSRLANKKLTAIVSVAMVVLLLTAIVVTMLLIDLLNKPQGNPVATITLSTGDKLEFTIYEDTAPIAATNFMFLSLKGFYNGTVIHDNQNNWLRFMGMTDYENYRGANQDYIDSFSGFDIYNKEWASAQIPQTSIFNYRLRRDTTAIDFNKENKNEGLLAFMYSYSSTLFQISCVNGPSTIINNSKRENFTVFGRYTNDSTINAIRAINLGSDFKDNSVKNGVWYNPNTVIRINKISISNYDKKAWEGKNGILNNFDTYMAELGGYIQHTTSYVSGI